MLANGVRAIQRDDVPERMVLAALPLAMLRRDDTAHVVRIPMRDELLAGHTRQPLDEKEGFGAGGGLQGIHVVFSKRMCGERMFTPPRQVGQAADLTRRPSSHNRRGGPQ